MSNQFEEYHYQGRNRRHRLVIEVCQTIWVFKLVLVLNVTRWSIRKMLLLKQTSDGFNLIDRKAFSGYVTLCVKEVSKETALPQTINSKDVTGQKAIFAFMKNIDYSHLVEMRKYCRYCQEPSSYGRFILIPYLNYLATKLVKQPQFKSLYTIFRFEMILWWTQGSYCGGSNKTGVNSH